MELNLYTSLQSIISSLTGDPVLLFLMQALRTSDSWLYMAGVGVSTRHVRVQKEINCGKSVFARGSVGVG